jgi:hypothetical protein
VGQLESLVQTTAIHIQHLQRALDRMNIQLHHGIGELTEIQGRAILGAVRVGERNPKQMAHRRGRPIVARK